MSSSLYCHIGQAVYNTKPMKKILFVCTGNICRSPTAEAVLRHAVKQASHFSHITCDSAGTHGYHIGEAPDKRTIATAKKRGIIMDDLRARQVHAADFNSFDLILGMDSGHVRLLKALAPDGHKAQIALFLEYAGMTDTTEVPDPYYGSQKDFDYVLNLIEAGVITMLNKLHHEP